MACLRKKAAIRFCAITLAICSMSLLSGCAEEPMVLPEEIFGVWSTTELRYAHRTFEVRPKAIVFGTGEFSAPALHMLVRIELLPSNAPEAQQYRLHFRERDGSIGQLDASFRSQPEPSLHFANRPETWTRVHSKKAAKEPNNV
jgi:hypothetical protein